MDIESLPVLFHLSGEGGEGVLFIGDVSALDWKECAT